MTSYAEYGEAAYFMITSLRAIALGAATLLALDALPGSRRARLITHWTVVVLWGTSPLWTGVSAGTTLSPQMINALVETYLIMLLTVHAYTPWLTLRIGRSGSLSNLVS